MLQFLPVFEGNTIAVRASGKLSHEDYQSFLPKLEEQIKELGKVSILFELDNFQGWDLKAAKDDFKFGMEHLADFERIAIVGDKAWEHWMTLMVKPFMPSDNVRYFDRDNLQDAWDWLREPQLMEQAAEQVAPYKTIVAAIDFSAYSRHAVKRAIEVATYYQAQLRVLHVVQEVVPYPAYYGDDMLGYIYDPEILSKENDELVAQAKKQMDEYIATLTTDIQIKPEVLMGDPDKTILSFLESSQADLVVFGAKKKRGINKLLGSTPHYIQNHARCETLVVPLVNPSSFKGGQDAKDNA